MTPVPQTRASLLLRLKDSHDQEAWETFLQIYQPLIAMMATKPLPVEFESLHRLSRWLNGSRSDDDLTSSTCCYLRHVALG